MREQEIQEFLEETAERGSVLGLENIRALMRELQDIQEQLKIIHVAGTNGKGSVCAMLASILKESGYKVGKYSSPAVFDPYEIIQIYEPKDIQEQNRGTNIRKEAYLDVMEQVMKACRKIEAGKNCYPTRFEVETAAAFVYFKNENCDYVVLETGMGGRTDATNLIRQPQLSVLTSISMDHMGFLGDTLEAIAGVKAGIVKQGCPVVTARQHLEAMAVIQNEASAKKSKIYYAKECSRISDAKAAMEIRCNGKEWKSALIGECQLDNIACVLAAVEALQESKEKIDTQAIRQGLLKVWHPGRFELVSEHPRILFDGAHNADAAEKLAETLKWYLAGERVIFVMGILRDKEYKKILKALMPYAQKVYVTQPDNPRALAKEELAEEIRALGVEAEVADTPKEALRLACEHQKTLEGSKEESPAILACGSLYYLHELEMERRKEEA